MNCTATVNVPTARSRRLSRAASFYLLASLAVSFLAASSAPTPLYATYQASWSLSPIAMTVVFAAYAVAVLLALLVTGRLSDHVGRRPVLFVAVAVQAATMLLFATASGLVDLLLARTIQGLSTGAAVAAIGAGLLDLDKARGTTANAISPMLGTATGSLVAGVLVQFLPAPTHLVYVLLFAVLVAQAVGVALMPETCAPKAGALASLRVQLRVPDAVRAPLLLAVPALVASWALAGFYASLGPTLLRNLMGFHSPLIGGLGLFVLAIAGALAVLLMKGHEPRRMMAFGVTALFVGVAIAMVALGVRSTLLFFAGTAIAGMGFGAGFQGAVRAVLPLAEPHERAGVLSVIFVVSYLAMGLPSVVAGYLLAHGSGIVWTAREFGAVVMALAALALAGTLLRRRA